MQILLKLLPLLKKYFAYILPLLKRYWVHIILVFATLTGAWYLWSPKPAPPETNKPAVVQADGSVIVARVPDADAKPKAVIPHAAKVERIVRLTLKAKNPLSEVSGSVEVIERQESAKSVDMAKSIISPSAILVSDEKVKQECPPVNLELALVRLPDDTRRVIASTDGEILSALDIPVESAAAPPEPKKNAAGITGSTDERVGVWYDRDISFMRIGGQVNNSRPGRFDGYEVWGKVGIRW